MADGSGRPDSELADRRAAAEAVFKALFRAQEAAAAAAEASGATLSLAVMKVQVMHLCAWLLLSCWFIITLTWAVWNDLVKEEALCLAGELENTLRHVEARDWDSPPPLSQPKTLDTSSPAISKDKPVKDQSASIGKGAAQGQHSAATHDTMDVDGMGYIPLALQPAHAAAELHSTADTARKKA